MSAPARPPHVRGPLEHEFWVSVQARELRLQRCGHCGAWRYPPASVCPACLTEGGEWTPLAGRGRVLAWTVYRRQYFPQLPPPYTVVAVQVEEGPILVGNWACGSARPTIGAAARVFFEDVGPDRDGWLLPQWEPTEQAGPPSGPTDQSRQEAVV